MGIRVWLLVTEGLRFDLTDISIGFGFTVAEPREDLEGVLVAILPVVATDLIGD